MRFWRSPHFKGRHRRANLTWSVCLVLRGFLFEVAGQLELSDFCHFDLFYFSTEMYTSILPTDAIVEQVSLNGENEKERAREHRWVFASAAGAVRWWVRTGLFSIGTDGRALFLGPLAAPVDIESSKHSLWDVLSGVRPVSQMKVTCEGSCTEILWAEAGPHLAPGPWA